MDQAETYKQTDDIAGIFTQLDACIQQAGAEPYLQILLNLRGEEARDVLNMLLAVSCDLSSGSVLRVLIVSHH
jgi:hypothetical protein